AVARRPDDRLAPDRPATRAAQGPLGQDHIEIPPVELGQEVGGDADGDLEADPGMEPGETTERGRQPAGWHLLHGAEAQRAGAPRAGQPAARRLLELQQAPGVAEEGLPVEGQRNRAGRALEQRPARLNLQTLDLLADRRLREVETLRGAAEPTGLGHGDE